MALPTPSPPAMRRSTAPLTLCLLIPTLSAQVSKEVADLIKKEGLENSQVMKHLDHLTNQIGPRLTGSDNFTLACDWTLSQFKEWGLDARKEKWATWPLVWNRGQWMGRVVEPVKMDLQVATSAWTPGTKGNVRGEVVRMPTTGEIDDKLKGKWVISRRSVRRSATAALVEAGVAGVLVSSRGDRAYPNRIRVFGTAPNRRKPNRSLAQVVIRRDQFTELYDLVRKAEEEDAKPVVAEFDIRNRFRDEPIDLYNVIADIKGTTKPDEYVIVCGHLDSWHQATGTTDNGTGTTSTMEAARILAKLGLRGERTIRFILWGGEEQGLLGSQGYVRRHRSEMDKISVVLNHDTGTNYASNLTVTTAMHPIFEKIMQPVQEMQAPDPDHEGPTFRFRAVERLGRGGGSDHASFLATGVPGFSWGLSGRSNYFQHTWHSQWDTFDVAIPEYQRHTSTVIALTALGIANLPELLPREGVGRFQPRADSGPAAEGLLQVSLDGMKVTAVNANGRGAKGGVQKGDVIVGVDEREVGRTRDLVRALRGKSEGFKLKVQRDGKTVTLEVPGRAPREGSRSRRR